MSNRARIEVHGLRGRSELRDRCAESGGVPTRCILTPDQLLGSSVGIRTKFSQSAIKTFRKGPRMGSGAIRANMSKQTSFQPECPWAIDLESRRTD